jgi:hypothetical protein
MIELEKMVNTKKEAFRYEKQLSKILIRFLLQGHLVKKSLLIY